MVSRPAVFIGSSVEGKPVAEAIQINLDQSFEMQIWNQGVFGLSGGILEELVKTLREIDFAILVLTPDDLIESRGDTHLSPRDNVLLEFGLCIGVLGRERTFAVYDRTAAIKIPSDLSGVTLASYEPHSTGNLQASLGASCTQIKNKINEVGQRERGRDAEVSFAMVSPARLEGIVGTWCGTITQYWPDGEMDKQEITIELYATKQHITGKAQFTSALDGYPVNIRIINGRFVTDRYVRLNYVDNRPEIIRFGMAIFEFSAHADSLHGRYIAYSSKQDGIVHGKIYATRPMKDSK